MPSNTHSISVDRAEEVVEGNYIAIQDVSQHRWYTKQLVVFFTTMLGLTGFHYLKPVSEIQEDQDRFEGDPVPVFKVKSKQVSSTVFEAVADDRT